MTRREEKAGPDPELCYRERRERFSLEAERLAARSSRLSNLRLLAFAVAAALAGWGLWAGQWPVGLAAVLGMVAFIALVIHHRRVERERRKLNGLSKINEEAQHRVARNWGGVPLRHQTRADLQHPYATDLDLFGWASVFHLLDTLGTWMGEQTLARWLLAPADPSTIRDRQIAVAELSALVDLRDELTWRARGEESARPDPEPFLVWAESEPWLPGRRGLLWAARISPPLLLSSAAAYFLGYLQHPIWVLFLFVNLGLSLCLVGPAVKIVRRVSALTDELGGYGRALETIASQRFGSPALRALTGTLTSKGVAAHQALAHLHRIALCGQPTSSTLYVLLELGLLWNVHVLDALERWQAANGQSARAWLDSLGEMEALAALAGLAHDNPEWSFPQIDPLATTLNARMLSHPLLRSDVRVANDVEVGPPGTFLLVTGSNMSGKSTLLRAIGVNSVLAQAGAPVCAADLRMPPVELWTSMRIQDSLERGVSYFMAELERLKLIVDASADGRGPRPLMYLLDEVLQGTNTAERQIAARRIIRLLSTREAIGAVSTHDLTLADAEDLAPLTRAIHLTEMVTDGADGPRMTFDYKLRPGIARSTNALKLMEMVGLPAE